MAPMVRAPSSREGPVNEAYNDCWLEDVRPERGDTRFSFKVVRRTQRSRFQRVNFKEIPSGIRTRLLADACARHGVAVGELSSDNDSDSDSCRREHKTKDGKARAAKRAQAKNFVVAWRLSKVADEVEMQEILASSADATNDAGSPSS